MEKEILNYNRGYLEALRYRLSEEIRTQDFDCTQFITEQILGSYLDDITKIKADRLTHTGFFYFKKKIRKEN